MHAFVVQKLKIFTQAYNTQSAPEEDTTYDVRASRRNNTKTLKANEPTPGLAYMVLTPPTPSVNIELSPVSDTSCLLN